MQGTSGNRKGQAKISCKWSLRSRLGRNQERSQQNINRKKRKHLSKTTHDLLDHYKKRTNLLRINWTNDKNEFSASSCVVEDKTENNKTDVEKLWADLMNIDDPEVPHYLEEAN